MTTELRRLRAEVDQAESNLLGAVCREGALIERAESRETLDHDELRELRAENATLRRALEAARLGLSGSLRAVGPDLLTGCGITVSAPGEHTAQQADRIVSDVNGENGPLRKDE